MKSIRYVFCILVVITRLFLQAQPLSQRNINKTRLPFDVNEVITQISNQHIHNQNRNGEFLIDTNVVYVSSSYNQSDPSAAFDGTNYLVVWGDDFGGSWNLYGARVDQSGIVLDPAGIVISVANGSQVYPSVAFDGTNYLVVWEDFRSGSSYDIYGARVSPLGVVLDPAGIAVSTKPNNDERRSAIASDGTNYFVVWDCMHGDSLDVYGARVDQSGVVIDTAGIPITSERRWQEKPFVAFDGTNYLVVWEAYGDSVGIYAARVDQSGNVLDSIGFAIATSDSLINVNPSVAFGDSVYLVVWNAIDTITANDIWGARVEPSGTVLDTTAIVISAAQSFQDYPSVNYDGTNFLVAWSDLRAGDYDIYGARVDQSGNVLDTAGIAISVASSHEMDPDLIFGGNRYLVVWEDFRNGPYGENADVYGARILPTGLVLDTAGIGLATAAYFQESPSVAFDGTNYLVVWEDFRSGSSYDIYGARVDQFGVVLDADCIAVNTEEGHQRFPSVAFCSNQYLVAWQEYRNGDDNSDIYCARVTSDGVTLDSIPICVSPPSFEQKNPCVGSNDSNYLIIWQDCGYSGTYFDIRGARVDQNGNVLDSVGIDISVIPEEQSSPSISTDGVDYLVVWTDFRSNSAYDIYGARVDASGNVLDSMGIVISTAGWDKIRPSVAFDGTNYLVVWQYHSPVSHFIYGARVDPSGTVLDTTGILITTASWGENSTSVAFDGANYLIVWDDYLDGSNTNIYGSRLNPSGVVIDSFVVASQPGNQLSPKLAHGQGNQILIVYSGFVDSINSHPSRTMRIWGKLYPFIGIEEDLELSNQTVTSGLRIYPNPVKKVCSIKYNLTQKTKINLSVYDITGRLLKKLISETQDVGVYQKTFELTDLAQGVYFIRLNTKDYSATRKIIFIK